MQAARRVKITGIILGAAYAGRAGRVNRDSGTVHGVSVRVGIGLFTGQVPVGSERSFGREYREMLDLVRLAESLGFDAAWVSEHHGTSDGYLPSLLAMLAAFAASTERIALGTGVVLAPLHDPLRLAEDAAVVDNLSDGRLILGLGLGWREEEFRMLRVPIAERGARLEETIEVLRRAWGGRRFSFDGDVFHYDRVRVSPPAARPDGPPIFLGGYARAAVRRAGRLANGYIADADDADEIRASAGVIDAAAQDAGRDPRSIALALMRNAFPWDEADAWTVIREGVAHQLGAYRAWEDAADTPDVDRMWIPPLDDEELRASTVAGRPSDVAASLRPLVEEFGDRRELHLIVRLHYPGMSFEAAARSVELFAEDVIPALKGE